MKKTFLAILLSLVALPVYADVSGYQVTQRDPRSAGYNITFYDNFSLSTLWGTITGHSGEYVVNSAGGTQTKGMRISHATGVKTIGIDAYVSTGTQTIKIRGAVGAAPNTSVGNIKWRNILEIINTGTVTYSFAFDEHYDFVQVSENITEIGTDSLSVSGSFLGTVERLDRDFTDGF